MKKFALLFVTAAMTIAMAATHRVTLFQESIVNGTSLKPGDYKMEVNGDSVVLSRGSNKVEAKAKVETASEKFSSTSVRYQNGDGKYRVREIRIGGTATKLVFDN